MKKIITIGGIFLLVITSIIGSLLYAHSTKPVSSMKEINNFHFVSEQLASSGMLALEDYQHIQDYGFKHVVNLIPGMQLKEKRHVESLGLSYQQIPVAWSEPTLDDFKQFVKLMKSYGEDKVYVHCQLNWRASSFVYLYRVTQLGIPHEEALRDLEAVWEPRDGWENFIADTVKAYQ